MVCGATSINHVTFIVSLLIAATLLFGAGYGISRFGASVEPFFRKLGTAPYYFSSAGDYSGRSGDSDLLF